MIKAIASIDYPFAYGGDYNVFAVNGTVAIAGQDNFTYFQVGPYHIDVNASDINNDVLAEAKNTAINVLGATFEETDTVNLINPLPV